MVVLLGLICILFCALVLFVKGYFNPNSIDINKKIRLFSDGTLYKKEEDKKVEEKKFELTSKKDMNLVKSQILKYLGENNTSLNMSKSGVKFVTKMFFGKKKLEFRLNLVQIEKKKL